MPSEMGGTLLQKNTHQKKEPTERKEKGTSGYINTPIPGKEEPTVRDGH
jgi:hypothetical protein